MIKLFLKELKLDVIWVAFVFPVLGIMTLLPNYPLIVGMGYSVLAVFVYFQYVRENLGLHFSAMLPVKRAHIVASTSLVVVMMQLAFAFFGGVGGVVAKFVNPDGNLVGLDPNFTFFGITFLCFGMFNLVFLPNHFKTGVKIGLPVVLGLIAFLLTYGVCEAVIQAVPNVTSVLDSYDVAYIGIRLAIFAFGIVFYILACVVATKKAVKNFEKVSL